jgi:hypothetical protein
MTAPTPTQVCVVCFCLLFFLFPMLDTHFAGDAAKLLTHAAYMPAGEKGWQPNASANQEG